MKKVNVLGTEYTIEERFAADDENKTSQFPKMVQCFREAGCLE